MNNLPIAIFANNTTQETKLFKLALEIIKETNKIFVNGSSNRFADLLKDPFAFFETKFDREKIVNIKIDPTSMRETINIPKSEWELVLCAIAKLIRSYESNYGNCSEQAVVSLYLASDLGSDILKTASIIKLGNLDHCLLKLETMDNQVLFIDPWFLSINNSGAIFNQNSFKTYANAIFMMLCFGNFINVLATFSRGRYVLTGMLIALATSEYAQHLPRVIKYLVMSLILLTILPIIEYYILQLRLETYLTIHNNSEPEAISVSFQLFKKLCTTNIENNKPKAIIFRDSMSVNNIETKLATQKKRFKNQI